MGMNNDSSQEQLRKEFGKPPTPQLKPKIYQRDDLDQRLLPGRPTFGGGNYVPPAKESAAPQRTVEDARKKELTKQLFLEQRKFEETQKRELQLKKERLAEKQAPERFSIQNESREIQKRKEANKNAPSNVLYRASGQHGKDKERSSVLKQQSTKLDQEFSQSLDEFEKSQENERHRFGEVIEFYRKEGELTISDLSYQAEGMKDHGHAQTIQRTEGRDGR